jgi:hypothetical protein
MYIDLVLWCLRCCWANIQETCKQITFHCATNQFLPEEVLNKQLPHPKTEEAKDVRRISVALDCLLPSPKEKANYGERLSRSWYLSYMLNSCRCIILGLFSSKKTLATLAVQASANRITKILSVGHQRINRKIWEHTDHRSKFNIIYWKDAWEWWSLTTIGDL